MEKTRMIQEIIHQPFLRRIFKFLKGMREIKGVPKREVRVDNK